MRRALTGRKRNPIRLLGGAARGGGKPDVDTCSMVDSLAENEKAAGCGLWNGLVEYAPWLHLNLSPSGLVYCLVVAFPSPSHGDPCAGLSLQCH